MAQGVPQRLENKCVFLRLKSPLQRPPTHSQEQTDVARVIKRNSGTLSLSLGFRQDKGHHKGGSSVRRVGGAWCGMSAALLRRGLELLAASEAPPAAASQAKASGAPVERARRAKAKASQARKLRNSAKGKVPKSALAEYQKRECQDHLQANLKFMTSMRSTVAESVSEQIVQQNRGRKACDRPAVRTKKKAEGTVFTEEDFQKFQQEYFGS